MPLKGFTITALWILIIHSILLGVYFLFSNCFLSFVWNSRKIPSYECLYVYEQRFAIMIIVIITCCSCLLLSNLSNVNYKHQNKDTYTFSLSLSLCNTHTQIKKLVRQKKRISNFDIFLINNSKEITEKLFLNREQKTKRSILKYILTFS